MDTLTIIYTIFATMLAIMLIISELLAWSDCKANAISQLHRCLSCTNPPKSDNGSIKLDGIRVDQATQSGADSWSV